MGLFPDIEYELKKRSPYHIPPVPDRYERKRGKNHFTYQADNAEIILQGTGLGDIMALRQFGRAIHNYFINNLTPELGKVVITTGSGPPAFNPEEGDINLYWWWSFGQYESVTDQYLEKYLSQTTVEPDIVLCPSKRTETEAKQLGLDTLRFPLGTYSFEPRPRAHRSGLGYAGTVNHKRSDKEDMVLGPFVDSSEFEWVDYFAFPEELNLWYNCKSITFGLHKEAQREWGMVNNRVFETLASGTPFVIESHPALEDVLGFSYPYQTESKAETHSIVEEMRDNPEKTLEEFSQFSKRIRKDHGYDVRVQTLINYLSD